MKDNWRGSENSNSANTNSASTKGTSRKCIGHIEPYVLGEDYSDYMERMDMLISLNARAEEI